MLLRERRDDVSFCRSSVAGLVYFASVLRDISVSADTADRTGCRGSLGRDPRRAFVQMPQAFGKKHRFGGNRLLLLSCADDGLFFRYSRKLLPRAPASLDVLFF